MFDIHRGEWDDELLALLDVPRAVLPAVVASSGVCAHAALGGAAVPIGGIAGDQQAALFGQACLEPGMAKNTYGTGCFLLLNTGRRGDIEDHMLPHRMASRHHDRFAFEEACSSPARRPWLRYGLKIIPSAAESKALAASVPTRGVYMVPAFAGSARRLGWPRARGDLRLTPGSPGDLARAASKPLRFRAPRSCARWRRRHWSA